ncbi:MAG: hypothetical protein ACRDUX_30155 [Mycobacterium sp.]
MTTGRVVLVVGPRLAGADGVVVALGRELPDHVVVGLDGLAAQRPPDAVIAVLSAVAPVTRTDWDLIERAAAGTDLVVAVVSKIDAHRGWRAVIEVDRGLVAGWHPRRRSMPWVGVAAAPDLGEPRLGELVLLLRERLAEPGLDQRNQLRRNEFRIQGNRTGTAEAGHRPAGADALQLRSVLQRTRLRLVGFVRDRCSALRAELREDASSVSVGGSDGFEAVVRSQAVRFLAELDVEITRAVGHAAEELAVDEHAMARLRRGRRLDPPDLSRPQSSSRRLEGRLMAVLGVGFGLGIALASSRLLAGLARGPSLLGLAVGLAVGLTLVVWVVRVRGLLHDRALLDRWVTEIAMTLRWHGEAVVAERLLAAESACVQARSRRTVAGVSGGPDSGRKHVTDQYEW